MQKQGNKQVCNNISQTSHALLFHLCMPDKIMYFLVCEEKALDRKNYRSNAFFAL